MNIITKTWIRQFTQCILHSSVWLHPGISQQREGEYMFNNIFKMSLMFLLCFVWWWLATVVNEHFKCIWRERGMMKCFIFTSLRLSTHIYLSWTKAFLSFQSHSLLHTPVSVLISYIRLQLWKRNYSPMCPGYSVRVIHKYFSFPFLFLYTSFHCY